MIYADWTRHKNLARGFNSFERAMRHGHTHRRFIGHAWRVEQRQDGWWVIHSYAARPALYFEKFSSEFKGPWL